MKRISDDETTSFSLRDISDLYASHTTYHCASNGCVPCAYKIGCFDVALDKEFCQAAPNQRPEQCPRSSREKGDLGTLGYQKGLNILTVGDGDFSFSLGVARIMSGTGLTATSYESKETLIQVYPQIEVTMAELESLGAKLHFQVDATRIRETLDTARPGLYDRIVWNFPCQAVAKGRDGQNEEMENNKKLVADFVSNTKGLLVRKGGQIHINHKTKPPFNQWKIENVVTASSTGDPPLHYFGRICFDRCLFPPYIPRKALDKKSFPVHDACTYIFGFDGQSNPLSHSVREWEGSQNSSFLIKVNTANISHIRRSILARKDVSNRNHKRLKSK